PSTIAEGISTRPRSFASGGSAPSGSGSRRGTSSPSPPGASGALATDEIERKSGRGAPSGGPGTGGEGWAAYGSGGAGAAYGSGGAGAGYGPGGAGGAG